MQFQWKPINPTWENAKKTLFLGPIFRPLGQKKIFDGFYLYLMLDIVASYHCMPFQGKLMNQTWEDDTHT